MILLKSILLLLTSLSPAKTLDITTLGARPSYCQSQEDATTLVISDEFKKESHQKFENNTLTLALISGDVCYRVGTEINLEHASGEIKLLGRAFINKVQIMTADDLLSSKIMESYDKSTTEQFLAQNKGKKINLVHFKIMEKITDTVLEEKYDRLPTCFVSRADWRTYPLDDKKWKEELETIKTGEKKSDIWNGTVNCYKVGLSADLRAKDVKEDLGQLIPTKVFLTHHSKITQEQADILGEKLSDLKDRLAKDKDKYGGYTTMVVYDYLAPKKEESQ